MNRITIAEIEKATGGRLISGPKDAEIKNVCFDSRKAQQGDLFVPIIGEVHDAHKFIPQVIEKGCRAYLTSREDAVDPDCSAILVEDTTKAVQALAHDYLRKLNLKTIAVTGSVGKTSTRDMVYFMLKEKYKTGTSVGNFNNDIGVPMTIFSFDDSLEAAVLEIGMDHFDEIHRLVDIIRPDVGIITNVGMSHIENLGSREGILKAKMEIVDYFGAENTLVVNDANDLLQTADYTGEYKVMKVGTEAENDYYVHDVKDFGEDGISYTLTSGGKDTEIRLNIPGAHNAVNSALAFAACEALGVSVEEAVKGLSDMELTGKRLTVKESRGIKVIDDTYNAAPDSMKSAVNTLMNTKGGRKIAVLGGMNELGSESPKYHREIGAYAKEAGVDVLITIGEKAGDIAKGFDGNEKNAVHFDKKEDMYDEIKSLFKEGDVVVVKASRTLELEDIVAKLIKEQE